MHRRLDMEVAVNQKRLRQSGGKKDRLASFTALDSVFSLRLCVSSRGAA